MNESIITDEWLSVETNRVPADREVLVRTATGRYYVAKWNGRYWVSYNSNSGREMRGRRITYFYVFERHPYDMGQSPAPVRSKGGFEI